ncbi:MAG: hypothetical protein ACYCS1_05455 [Gammaproteobacteria bacterium]
MATRELDKYKEYVVDIRLKRFRLQDKKGTRLIPFDSEKGDKLLSDYINSLSDEKAQIVFRKIWAVIR